MKYTDSKVQILLENNRKVLETWKTPPTMEQMRAMTSKAGGGFIVCLFPTLPALTLKSTCSAVLTLTHNSCQ